jgi:hypothetical protein
MGYRFLGMSGQEMRRRVVLRRQLHATLTSGFWLLWVLAGCGGGGASGGSSAITVPSTATATAVAPRTMTFTASQSIPAATPTPTPPDPTVGTTPISPTSTRTLPLIATATLTPTVEVPPTTASPTDTAPPNLTPTATETPPAGPIVSAFGVADASGTFNMPVGRDDEQRWVFAQRASAGFIIFVEGRPGLSRLPVGTVRFNYDSRDPSAQPDIQMVSSQDLGTATQAVCDGAFPQRGGVPAIEPPRFDGESAVSDALNDLSCRFKLFAETDFACTQDRSGNYVFSNNSSTMQFCTLVDDALTFPSGETVLTARLRDTAGNAGPQAQIVVRVSGAR